MSDFIVGILVGVPAGMFLMYFLLKIILDMAIKKLTQDIGDLDQVIEKFREDRAIDCRVESHNGVFFVYNNDTNEFMAQGSTLVELRERIKSRWANVRVSVVAGEQAVLEQLKAELNESSSSQ